MGKLRDNRPGFWTITPGWVRCLVALTLGFFDTWLVNAALYPQYTSVMAEARDAASLVGVVTLVLLSLWARRRPSSIDEGLLSAGSLILYSIAFVLIMLGIHLGNPVLLLLGACMRALSTRWIVVLTGLALCTLSGRSCMLCIASALLASYFLRIPFSAVDLTVSLAVLFAIPFITYAVCRPMAREMVAVMKEGPAPVEASITQPSSYVPFSHKLFMAIIVFRIAYGFALTFGSVDGNPQQTLFTLVPIALIFVMALMPRIPSADVLYRVAALLVVCGFLLAVVLAGRMGNDRLVLVNGLLYAGSECFDALIWFSLASIGARNKVNALTVFAWGRAASSAGLLVGATAGHLVNGMSDFLVVSLIIAAVLLVFVALNFTVLNGFSFQETIEGVHPPEPIALVQAFGGGFRQQCLFVAEAHVLTPRETEVLTLLAHGRNGPYIQEKLVLSRNTVKTHVANIYAKLGVHSQQELIDLVEKSKPLREG